VSTEPTAAPAATPSPKKSRKGLFIVLTLVVILLAGGGGGAYWFMFRGTGEAEAAEAEPPPAAPTGVIPLEPFVVNLADPTGSRFLRVTLSLVVADEAIAHEVEEDEVVVLRVRSAILELLAQKQASELVTPEGKTELKKSIAEGVKHAAHELEVADVLFSEFIVQF
jgi:flagellar protein FliL